MKLPCCSTYALQVPALTCFPSTNSAKTRVRRFIGQAQECLLDTAQQEWLVKRGLGHQGA